MEIGQVISAEMIPNLGQKFSKRRENSNNLNKANFSWPLKISSRVSNITPLPTCMSDGKPHLSKRDPQLIVDCTNSISPSVKKTTTRLLTSLKPSWPNRISHQLTTIIRDLLMMNKTFKLTPKLKPFWAAYPSTFLRAKATWIPSKKTALSQMPLTLSNLAQISKFKKSPVPWIMNKPRLTWNLSKSKWMS